MADLHTTVPDPPVTVLKHALELAAAWRIPFRVTEPPLGQCAECARRGNTTPAAVAVEWNDAGQRVLTPFCLAVNCTATAMTRAQLSGHIAALLIPNGFSATRRPGGCLDEAATA